MPTQEIEISEIEEFEPSRVDGVKSAANGFPILMLKSIDGEVMETESTLEEVITELDKAATSDTTEELPDATVEDVLDEMNKRIDPDDDRPICKMCKGSKSIKGGSVKCPQCKGSGFQPMVGQTEKELLEVAAKDSTGVAPSGVEVPLPIKCPTCNGSGTMRKDGKTCVDCGGSGKDAKAPTDDALHTMDAPGATVSEGDPQGREKIDKAINLYEADEEGDLEKAKLKAKARDALPDSAFALPDTREYPIHDENHARAALSMLHNASPEDQKKIKAAVHRRYPNIGGDAEKADGTIFSASNPNLPSGTAVNGIGDDAPEDDPSAPGSPAWEAVDAQTATDAAMALIAAGGLMRRFAQREAMEVAAGEGNDVFDTYVVTDALCGVNHAVGVMAQMAFHEGLEAAKGLPGDEVVEKTGRRLAGRTVNALVAARDKATDLSTHITGVLGKDDPAKKSDDGDGKSATAKFIESANKARLEEELSNMGTDELEKVLDARDEKLVGLIAEALKGDGTIETEVEVDADAETAEKAGAAPADLAQTESIANAKTENSKGKSRKKKVATTDDVLEDEATQGNDVSASGTDQTSGTKSIGDDDADLTPEEIEARDARKAAKKALKEAKRAEEQAAQNAATAKAIEEAVAKATEAVDSLKEQLATAKQATEDRLATVEKMAAPSPILKTRPADAVGRTAEKDAIDVEIARYEQMAKEMRTSNPDYARECRDRVKVLKGKVATLDS